MCAKQVMNPDDYMVKLDLKDVYLTVAFTQTLKSTSGSFGRVKPGRSKTRAGERQCVMRVPPSHLVSKVHILFFLIKNGGSK